MSRRRRLEERDVFELAAGVPDAVAILDDAGNVIGWDDAAANAYLTDHGLPRLDREN